MDNTLQILKYAMEMERQGKMFYLKYKDEIQNEKAKKVFANLAEVEEEHYNILKKHYDGLESNKNWSSTDLELSSGEEIFQKVLEEEKDKMTEENLDSNFSDMAIMRMAYLIENDFANYYRDAIKKADNEQAKNLLKTLAEWEDKHREYFYNEFKGFMEESWFDQNFYPF
ncbi:ferritin family protein [Clostridium sp. D2Q-11]|uniref:Ferritin family protein n=1 Tax=Anaeromonas frigoriresistens TaxID=2683708 RepID=A0A942V034_9FIRM|nr:ferritin family protein [Anaeromonas frigoriresistens]MBS4537617.1 ferritin family protein [Anaeromonas frigoriresistens]